MRKLKSGMRWARYAACIEEKYIKKTWLGNMKEMDHLRDLDVGVYDGIILAGILKRI